MGTGSSAEKKVANVQHKMAVVQAFGGFANTKGTSPSVRNKNSTTVEQHRRSDVYDFVKAKKAEKEADWSQIKDKHTDKSSAKSLAIDNKQQKTMNPLYDYKNEEEMDNVCPLCGKATMVGVDGHGCRICARMYHKPCLKSRGHYTDAELKLVDRSSTAIGWSCPDCDNICNLLSPDQMRILSEEFENFDINKDAKVSEEEYINFMKSQYEREEGCPMPDFEMKFEIRQFKSLDANSSGSIDYLEFMKHRACRKLAIKDKEDLVKLLTLKERKAARSYYETFDSDGDGIVYELEAKMALRTFYSSLEQRISTGKSTKPDKDGMVKAHTDSQSTTAHVALRSGMLMDGDENNDNILTWKEFLRNQAIYIISSRPNKAYVGSL